MVVILLCHDVVNLFAGRQILDIHFRMRWICARLRANPDAVRSVAMRRVYNKYINDIRKIETCEARIRFEIYAVVFEHCRNEGGRYNNMTVLRGVGILRRRGLSQSIICIFILLILTAANATNSQSNDVRLARSVQQIEQSQADKQGQAQNYDTASAGTYRPQVAQSKRKVIHIGAIFPMSGQWAGGLGCRPAAEMAVEEVNSRSDILADYRLELDVRDSQCSPGLGTRKMYELLYEQPTKLMFLGPGCSLVSTFVAEAARSWNLVVLSWGSSSPALSDRTRFPTFFRTHPSAVLQNPAQIMMFKKWNWTRIAILQHIEEVFTTTVENLQMLAREEKIEISPRTSFAGADDVEQAIKQLKNQDARIIVGLFYENMARRVFCEAYKHGLYGSKYVWFIIGWFVDNWYELELNQTSCTAEEMRTALEGHFTTESLMMNRNRSQVTWTGITGQQFIERLEARYRQLGVNDSAYQRNGSMLVGFVEAPLAYDAVWALAIAINKTIGRLERRNLLIENFTYQNDEIFRTLHSSMQETKFLGVSTEVEFTHEGDRNMLTQIEQFRNGRYHKVGYYDPNRPNETEWMDENDPVFWPDKRMTHEFPHSVLATVCYEEGCRLTRESCLCRFSYTHWRFCMCIEGKPPRDRTYVVERYRHVNKTLYWTFCAVAWLMMALCLLCLAFTITFKKFNCVKCTQPMFNQLTLFGFLLSLLTIMLNGLDQEYIGEDAYTTLCTVRASLLCYGFSFSYGAMFCKIWMVYRLAPKRKGATPKAELKKEHRTGYRHDIRLPGDLPSEAGEMRQIRSWEPKILFLALIICDSLILMLLTIFDPLRRSIQKFPLETPSTQETTDDIKYQPLLELCTSSTHLHAWLGLCFGYKGLLLIAGLLIAYDTRNVKVDSISDSRFVALCVYNVVILCIITASVSLIITDQQNPQFAFVSAVILLCTLLSIALIFGPKALFILRFGVRGAAEVERKEQNERLRERQEQQKYRELVAENEDLQRRIQSTDEKIRECKSKLNARIDQRLKLTSAGSRDHHLDGSRLSSTAVVHANAAHEARCSFKNNHEKMLRFHLNSTNESDATSGIAVNGTSGCTTSEAHGSNSTTASNLVSCIARQLSRDSQRNHEMRQDSRTDRIFSTNCSDSSAPAQNAQARSNSNDRTIVPLRTDLRDAITDAPSEQPRKDSEDCRISNVVNCERSSTKLVVYTETCI